ncbi:MAG: acyl-ACP--UDP-N-acetylglucosamine O-acyltransferase [Phycisphaerales bacterium]|nr:acyl-ACP--UDP-N-acetylglucosamine O-acyltransferase [Phycisphaerales bacterium]
MTRIHPTAIIDDRVEMAEDVEVGPYSILQGRITIGAGTRIRSHVYLQGPMTIGEKNDFWPFACIGTAPQTHHFDPDDDGPGTVIGDHNSFREHSSIHRSIHETDPTRIGHHNLFMDSAHAGHDSIVHDHVVISKGAALGGHVIVENNAIIGGGAMVHQFCRIGRGAMLGGLVGMSRDIMPWFMATEMNVAATINAIGMKRNGHNSEDVDIARWVYRLICRSNLTVQQARAQIESRAGHALVDEYLLFLDRSTRTLCTATGRRVKADRSQELSTADSK